MDAYQYFYDAAGNELGYAPTGTMQGDARDGHHHWHFTDFARYQLLDASGKLAVRSGKGLLPDQPRHSGLQAAQRQLAAGQHRPAPLVRHSGLHLRPRST